jgi:hypothetical protein
VFERSHITERVVHLISLSHVRVACFERSISDGMEGGQWSGGDYFALRALVACSNPYFIISTFMKSGSNPVM